MRDQILGSILLVLLFIGSTEAYAGEIDWSAPELTADIFEYGKDAYYLTAEQNNHFNESAVCQEHDDTKWTDEQLTAINLAFDLAWCANYVRLVDGDYHLGWKFFKQSSQSLSAMNCECNLHNHADHLGYNIYMELNTLLLTGEEVNPAQVKYCAALALVMNE